MYSKRLKIFIGVCAVFAGLCMTRLAYMQLSSSSSWQRQIEEFRTGIPKQLPTLRGRILDRNGEVLACDEAKFTLSIDYSIVQMIDERFWLNHLKSDYSDELEKLDEIIYRCARFEGISVNELTARFAKEITNPIWNVRLHLAWKRKCPNDNFAEVVPDVNERLLLTAKVDIAEMHQSYRIINLNSDDEVLAAQLEFIDTEGVRIEPKSMRRYPYETIASQLIGWVRTFDNKDLGLVDEQDELQSYQYGETAGFCGVEYVCETILRGRRGKVIYNIDRELVGRTDRNFGEDVMLTVDIELQKKIEKLLLDRNLNDKWWNKPMAAVVIDVNSAGVLAIVSLPDFDLNTARSKYGELENDPNRPLINKAIAKQYPPGSTAKPVIFLTAMEEGKITADEQISCGEDRPQKGWPRCWYQKKFGYGHDGQWAYEGGNKARNALKGSCNIYFSRLASRLNPNVLQKWLYNFGFGRAILQLPKFEQNGDRNFQQVPGIISSQIPTYEEQNRELLPPLKAGELRYFGLGQGNFRATPLQIANAMATIARGGIYKSPKLLLKQTTEDNDAGQNLAVSKEALETVRDGMGAVVGEYGGTAHTQFKNSGFSSKGVSVYGKTGSTENPDNALFAGFAEDSNGASIALVVVVEGGQHGSSDAGPLARDIISICIEDGYLGN